MDFIAFADDKIALANQLIEQVEHLDLTPVEHLRIVTAFDVLPYIDLPEELMVLATWVTFGCDDLSESDKKIVERFKRVSIRGRLEKYKEYAQDLSEYLE